jgi:hypothetical protein
MAKATFTLPNGTVVNIDGKPLEIQQLLNLYAGSHGAVSTPLGGTKKRTTTKTSKVASATLSKGVNLAEIINFVKNCDEAENIEKNILDRISQVDRVLLPLYIVHEYMGDAYSLKTGEINKVTVDLGIPISTANISHTLSGTASRYVISDRVRKKGQPVGYKLSRRGLHYLKAVIKGTKNEK